MRVRTTLLLLLCLVGAAFVVGWNEVRRVEQEKFVSIARSREEAWRQSVASFLESRRRPLADMAVRYAEEKEPLQAILDQNTDLAASLWDDRSLGGFGANAIWVFRPDGTLFYTHANTHVSELQVLPVADVRLLFGRGKVWHFFFSLENSEGQRREYVEVFGRAVFADREGVQPIQGAIFVGRIWDSEMLKELRFLAGEGRVEIDLPFDEGADHASASRMVYRQDLPDWQGRRLARLTIINESGSLASLETWGQRLFYTLIFASVALLVALYLLLHRTIVRPLRMVIQSLHSENLALLEPLRRRRAEFGQLARLIHDFFGQRTELMREMRERSAAEKALRASEEMLRHSQKMEAVGRLAGGVAHDFNNLLTAIIGYADLLRQRFAHDISARQPADLIHQAGEQAAGLTRQLLAFSRKQLLQPKTIDLNTIVGNLHRLLQRVIGEHIEITTELDPAACCVHADPGQIEQVIINLGVNARDAMPRGGKLCIRTCRKTLSVTDVAAELPPGEYVALEIIDTGEGMDEETRGRIFEPFFTTKGPGKGTGLGLATVYGIVRQSHGGIVVESERGRGTTFRILLPHDDALAEVFDPVAAAEKTGGAEKILVVEDEEIVRDLVCEILRGEGYEVVATGRGSEAAQFVRHEHGDIDLLISDVVMPEMNGAEVAHCVHELVPSARVLFVSGYSEKDMEDQGLEALAFQVLQKPFTPDSLARKVREVLDAPLPEEDVNG